MNIYLKVASILCGIIGGIVVVPYPVFGISLLIFTLIIEILFFTFEKNEEEKREGFNFQIAKSLVKAGQPNPYKEILENELSEAGMIYDLIPKYKKIFKVDSNDFEVLSKLLAGYGVLVNHEIAIHGSPKKETLKEANFYISLALEKFKNKLNLFILVSIALTYDAMGDFEKSHPIYQELISSDPKSTTVIDSYGMSLLMSNHICDSVKLLKSAVKERNFTNVTLYNLGCANQALGHFSTANLYFKYSYRLSKRWKTLVRIAENHFLTGNFKAAFFTEVLCNIKGGFISKGSILNIFASLFLAFVFGFAVILSFTIGKVPFIGAFYYKKIKPALWFQDVVKRHLEEFPDAFAESINFLKKLLIIDPHNELVLYNLGIFYAKLGNRPKMLECFNKVPYDSNLQEFIKEISRLKKEELKNMKLEGHQES